MKLKFIALATLILCSQIGQITQVLGQAESTPLCARIKGDTGINITDAVLNQVNWQVAAESSLPDGCPEYTFKSGTFERQRAARYWRIIITSAEHWDRSELLELLLYGGDL